MKFKYYKDMFAKTLDFKGKSSVAEYWVCVLYNIIFSTLIVLVGLPFVQDWNLFLKLCDSLSGIYNFIVFLPMLALTIRRLHDASHTGWSLLLILIPVIGLLILLMYLITPSQKVAEVWSDGKKENAFSPNNSEPQNTGINYMPTADSQKLEEKNDAIVQSAKDSKPAEEVDIEEKQPQESKQEVEPKEAPKPKARKSKSASNTKEKPLSRSQKIAELQQKQQNGEITEEEYHKQVLDILKH